MSKITNQNYPNGLNPLGYMGVNAPTPGQQVVQLPRAPLPTDAQNFTIGTQWLANVSGVKQIWELVDLAGGVATWVQLYPAGGGGGGASQFPTDSGTANEVGGVLNILGDGLNIATSGSGNTVTVALDSHITVGSITDTSLSLGVVQSDVSGNLTSSNGTNGQVLIGQTGVAPAWNTLTPGNNIDIANGSHSITIATTTNMNIPGTLTVGSLGQGVVQSSAGGLLSSSQGTDGQILIGSSIGAPAWANITAGAGISVTNGHNSITITNTGGGGGGGITTLTANTGVAATAASIKLQGNNIIATNGVSTSEIDFSLTNGTNGQVIIGGGSAPAWASITAGTNITLTPGANSLTIAATGTAPAAGCAFFYYQPTRASNVLGTNTFYGLGATVVMASLFDNTGGAVTPGNGAGTPLQFTAPATGLYFLSMVANTQTGGTSTVQLPSVQISITGNIATANNYFEFSQSAGSTTFPIYPGQMSGMFYMTAGDVAIFQVTRFTNAVLNAHVNGTATFSTFPSSQNTWVSGYRVA